MSEHKIALTLSGEHLDHASEALSGAARALRQTLPRLGASAAARTRLDAEIFEQLAAQLEVARLEAGANDEIPVELVFASLGEKGGA